MYFGMAATTMLWTMKTLPTHMLRGWTILTLTACLLAAPLLAPVAFSLVRWLGGVL